MQFDTFDNRCGGLRAAFCDSRDVYPNSPIFLGKWLLLCPYTLLDSPHKWDCHYWTVHTSEIDTIGKSTQVRQCSHWNSHCEFYSQCEVFCKWPRISYTLMGKKKLALPYLAEVQHIPTSPNCPNIEQTCQNLLKHMINASNVQPYTIHNVACTLKRKDKPFLTHQ